MAYTHPPTTGTQPPDLQPLLAEMGKLLHWAHHDGLYDGSKEFWEQDIQEFKTAWERLTHPVNVDMLRSRLGTAGNADWNRIFAEAYRQSLARERARTK